MLTTEERATWDDFAAWARKHHPLPHVREAAAKGYDVRGLVMTHVAEVVSLALPEFEVETFIEGTAPFQGLKRERRENPFDYALRAHALVKNVLGGIEFPARLNVQVLPIQRVTFWSGTERQYHRTAVVVRLLAEGVGERLHVIHCELLDAARELWQRKHLAAVRVLELERTAGEMVEAQAAAERDETVESVARAIDAEKRFEATYRAGLKPGR